MSCKNSDNEIKKIILSIANSTISVTDITDNMNLIEDLNYDWKFQKLSPPLAYAVELTFEIFTQDL